MSEIGRKILELHEQGVRSIDIAHRLDVAQATVHYHLRKLDDPPPPRRRRAEGPTEDPRSKVRTRERVLALLADGLTRAEIARTLRISPSVVSYHARRAGLEVDERCARRYDWTIVQAYYDEGHSVRDCQRAFGFSSGSWHEAVKRGAIVPRPTFQPVEEIFVRDSRRNRGHLKHRLLRLGIKDGRCEGCGLAEWCGEPISMTLHHINGDRNDNRIENLALLCPNCHSQTDSFGGRNGPRALRLVR